MDGECHLLEAAPLEATEMRCMSVFTDGDKIAFACYIEAENEILLEQSHANGYDTEAIIELFLTISRPNLLLCSSKVAVNAELLRILTTPTNPISSMEASTMRTATISTEVEPERMQQSQHKTDTIPFKILKSGAFELKSCRRLLLEKLRVLSLLRHNQEHRMQKASAYRSRLGINTINDRNFQNDNISASSTMARNYVSYNSLAALIDFESTTLTRALGSLVTYLQDTTFRMGEGSFVTVNSISYAKSANFMRIDATTLRSLHIFSTEHHPLIAKGSGNSKEGFSLFTLLDRCKSKIGRQCLREWMLKPVLDPSEISRRQDGIDLFLRPEMHSLVGVLLKSLQQVGAIDKILLRIQKCHSLPVDFLTLSAALKSAVAICNILSYDLKQQISATCRDGWQQSEICLVPDLQLFGPRSVAFLDSLLERCFVPALQGLYERITSVVDEVMTSQVRDAVVIRSGFNEELDNAKSAFYSLSDTLSAVGAQVIDKYPELRHIKVVFLPQVGFLIKLDRRHHARNEVTNDFTNLPETFFFIFQQSGDAYFKNEDMRQLDEEIGDLDSYIRDTEDLIKSELEDDILDCEGELRSTFSALAELDCILSLTSCAADLEFSRPEIIIGDAPVIYIENGRHPLQELIIEGEFVKNDTLVDQNSKINIITGSNFSGKSCYLRQVGVLVYLAHIGSFLPCARAKVSITDQILARISSVETCAVPQSSFQLDLTQMAVILRKSTPKTLVLIDEFGKGTAPASGVAVLSAAIHKLSQIGCKVICTTHFLEIFSLHLLHDSKDGVSALRMAVHISEGDNFPLFRLEKGIATASAGLACAQTAGVQGGVLTRVKEILDATKEGRPVPPIPDNLNYNSALQTRAKLAIHAFISVDDWIESSKEDLLLLEQKVSSM